MEVDGYEVDAGDVDWLETGVAAAAEALRYWQQNDPDAMRYYVNVPGEYVTTVWIDKAEIPARVAVLAFLAATRKTTKGDWEKAWAEMDQEEDSLPDG